MYSESNLESINFVKRQFLCCVPVKQIQWKNVLKNLSWEDQEMLINSTVNHETVLTHPVRITYQQKFVKIIIDQLEKQNEEVNDVVYNAFGRLVALKGPNVCYKHYVCDVKSDDCISLIENVNIVSEGTTGLCSWQAAIALAEWCKLNADLLRNKRILELGSGIGLTGLVACKYCAPKKFYFTDCHTSVLKNLKRNVEFNLEKYSKKLNEIRDISKTFSQSEIEILNLPWENINKSTCLLHDVDVVLAADVVYDSNLFGPLCQAIENFLKYGNCQAVYLSSTERNPETLSEFLNLLGSRNLLLEKLETPSQSTFFWDTETPIIFYKISW